MSAAPQLRRNLRFIEQTQNGVVAHVVKDPVTLKYYRFGTSEVGLMQLMNGQRSLGDIVETARTELNLATSEGAVERFVRRLKDMGLVERTQEERSALLVEFVRRARDGRRKGHGGTVLRMRFSLGDPDVLLARMHTALPFFFTPAFIAFSAVLFAIYILVVGTHWESFTMGMGALRTASRYTAGFVVMLYATALVIFLIHEFGHGLTCKHFGGEVHELGVMLIYFMPAFYCNVNDAWTFEKRAHRLWVTFAGGWIQMVVASLAALVWVATENGTIPHDVAFITLLIGGGLTLLINFNPLIPLDGYYALVDWTGLPNLRKRAFEYVGAHLKRIVLRNRSALPDVTPREARIFLIYGALSLAYVSVILFFLALRMGSFFTRTWGAWGLVIFLVLFWKATRRMRQKIVRSASRVRLDRVRATARRIGEPRIMASLVVLTMVLLLPWTVRVSGPAVIEPVEHSVLRPPEAARVERVLVQEGDVVSAGQALAVLRNPQLEIEWSSARAAVNALEHELAAASGHNDEGAARVAELQLEERKDILERLNARREALTLRAPFDARVVSAHTDELIGASLQAGDSLLALESGRAFRARVSLAERDAGDIISGDAVWLKFPVHPSWTWRARIAATAPAGSNGHLDVLVPIAQADADAPLKAGMMGNAIVAVRRTTVAGAAARTVRRLLRTDLLL